MFNATAVTPMWLQYGHGFPSAGRGQPHFSLAH